MKRNLLLLILILLISCSLCIFASADDSLSFSDDLTSFEMDSETFLRVNGTALDMYFEYGVDNVLLTRTQKEQIEDIQVYFNANETVAEVSIFYKDGSMLSAVYMAERYVDQYNDLLNGKAKKYSVDFEWPDGNVVTSNADSFFGEAVTLKGNRIISYEEFAVNAVIEDTEISVSIGTLIFCQNEIYFVDFSELDITYWYEFYLSDYSELSAWKITDAALLEELNEAKESYDNDFSVFSFGDDVSGKMVSALLIAIFAVLPFVLFVIFFVKSFKATYVYKRLFYTICVLCALELIAFTIIATMIVM